MSSPDEGTVPILKRRKLQRACDYCRSRKGKHRHFECMLPQNFLRTEAFISSEMYVLTAAVTEGSLSHPGTAGDGSRMPNGCCSNCAARRAECTYVLGYVRVSINVINEVLVNRLTGV